MFSEQRATPENDSERQSSPSLVPEGRPRNSSVSTGSLSLRRRTSRFSNIPVTPTSPISPTSPLPDREFSKPLNRGPVQRSLSISNVCESLSPRRQHLRTQTSPTANYVNFAGDQPIDDLETTLTATREMLTKECDRSQQLSKELQTIQADCERFKSLRTDAEAKMDSLRATIQSVVSGSQEFAAKDASGADALSSRLDALQRDFDAQIENIRRGILQYAANEEHSSSQSSIQDSDTGVERVANAAAASISTSTTLSSVTTTATVSQSVGVSTGVSTRDAAKNRASDFADATISHRISTSDARSTPSPVVTGVFKGQQQQAQPIPCYQASESTTSLAGAKRKSQRLSFLALANRHDDGNRLSLALSSNGDWRDSNESYSNEKLASLMDKYMNANGNEHWALDAEEEDDIGLFCYVPGYNVPCAAAPRPQSNAQANRHSAIIGHDIFKLQSMGSPPKVPNISELPGYKGDLGSPAVEKELHQQIEPLTPQSEDLLLSKRLALDSTLFSLGTSTTPTNTSSSTTLDGPSCRIGRTFDNPLGGGYVKRRFADKPLVGWASTGETYNAKSN